MFSARQQGAGTLNTCLLHYRMTSLLELELLEHGM